MLVLLDQRLEGAAIAVLVDEVHVVGGFENLDEFNNVSGVFYFGEGLYFVDGELFESRTEFILLYFYNFDSHGLLGLFVDGLVDLAEFPLADHHFEAVVLDFLAHCS